MLQIVCIEIKQNIVIQIHVYKINATINSLPLHLPCTWFTCLRQMIKREVRCNPVTIPVAVIPPPFAATFEQLHPLFQLYWDGKEVQKAESQKTCQIQQDSRLSGEKHGI